MVILRNSMTRRLDEFLPFEDKKVKMYTSGLSIYQMPHIGNYCTFLYEDILVLRRTQSTDNSAPRARKLIATLKEEFRANMNNDLHVKGAFDATFGTVSKLCSLAEKGKMSAADSSKATTVLRNIDQVLQVIF